MIQDVISLQQKNRKLKNNKIKACVEQQTRKNIGTYSTTAEKTVM
jgi:hypothetical protein